MLVIFESTVVKRRMKSLEDVRSMRMKPYAVQVKFATLWCVFTAVCSGSEKGSGGMFFLRKPLYVGTCMCEKVLFVVTISKIILRLALSYKLWYTGVP
jgi:hypothetical protein